jgi:hypothetical protein
MKYFLQVGIVGAVLVFFCMHALIMSIELSFQQTLPLPIKNDLIHFITGSWVISVAIAYLLTWTIPEWYEKWKARRNDKRES